MQYQLTVRIPEFPGARPAPWCHGMLSTDPAEIWIGMMMARARGFVCKVNRVQGMVEEDHDLFDADTIDTRSLRSLT